MYWLVVQIRPKLCKVAEKVLYEIIIHIKCI